jgi:hypothetical protein
MEQARDGAKDKWRPNKSVVKAVVLHKMAGSGRLAYQPEEKTSSFGVPPFPPFPYRYMYLFILYYFLL